MARKKIWDYAVKDLRAAARVSSEPLSKAEISTLRAAFGSKYGCDEILEDPKIVERLCELADVSLVGAQMVSALARGLRWRVRTEFAKIRCWKSVSYFLLMNKLNRASSMTITAKNSLPLDWHESQSARHS